MKRLLERFPLSPGAMVIALVGICSTVAIAFWRIPPPEGMRF